MILGRPSTETPEPMPPGIMGSGTLHTQEELLVHKLGLAGQGGVVHGERRLGLDGVLQRVEQSRGTQRASSSMKARTSPEGLDDVQ